MWPLMSVAVALSVISTDETLSLSYDCCGRLLLVLGSERESEMDANQMAE